jgi:hypothetical protein
MRNGKLKPPFGRFFCFKTRSPPSELVEGGQQFEWADLRLLASHFKKNVAKLPGNPAAISGGVFCLAEGIKKMNTIKDDVGIQTVQEIYNSLQVDEEWSIREERGFTWWANQFKQTIRVDQPIEDDSLHISRVHVETEFLKYPKRSEKIDTQLARMLKLSSLSGLIHDPQSGRLKWRCNAFVHEENNFWLINMLCFAAILQLKDAQTMALLSEQLELKLECDHSCHPESGPREQFDDDLKILDRFIISEGQKPISNIGQSEFENISQMLNNQKIFTSTGENSLAGYVPFGRDVSLLQIDMNQPHPLLGNGILYRLSLPPEDIWPVASVDGALTMDMNINEQKDRLTGHFLGSWCLGPAGENTLTPTFVSFIPAVVCSPNVLVNMTYSTLMHNTFAEGYFFAYDRHARARVPEEAF